jgi:hypothetical protein
MAYLLPEVWAGQVRVTASLKLSPGIVGSTIVNVTAVNKPCQDVSGAWFVNDSATTSCSGSFGQDSQHDNASGTITIIQNGCSISFMSPANTLRSGTIAGNTLQVSGIAAIASPGITITQNNISFNGTLSANGKTINMTGIGIISGYGDGESGSCSISSTETLSR